MKVSNHYPEFEYKAEQLSKFISAADIVTIMLKNREIIHFLPKDKTAFLDWLTAHGIADIKEEK